MCALVVECCLFFSLCPRDCSECGGFYYHQRVDFKVQVYLNVASGFSLSTASHAGKTKGRESSSFALKISTSLAKRNSLPSLERCSPSDK